MFATLISSMIYLMVRQFQAVEVIPAHEAIVAERQLEAQNAIGGEVAEGNIITFGKFEQDGNLENGPEDIEWHVLKVEDGKATLYPVYSMLACGADDIDATIEEFASTFTDAEKSLMTSGPTLFTSDEYASFLTDVTTDKGKCQVCDKKFLCEYTNYCKNHYHPYIDRISFSRVIAYRTKDKALFQYEQFVRDGAGSWGRDIAEVQTTSYLGNAPEGCALCPYIVIDVNK